MYGRLHQRKLKQEDYIMSCQKARRQLGSYIDQQAKRVNIDSAKKRAVLQHMDYDGFRQMVLGANIFPTKTTELQKFTKGENGGMVQNKLFLENGNNQNHEKTEKMHAIEILTQVQGKSELLCNSFRQFKKKFTQNYPKNGQFSSINAQSLYTLIKHQDQQRIAKIFNIECETNILVKIVDLFEFVIQYLRENDIEGNVVKEAVFQVKFLETVIKLKTMREFSLSILSKKQRALIMQFLTKAKNIMVASSNNAQGTQAENKKTNIQKNDQNQNNEGSGKIISQIKAQSTYQTPINQDQKSINELIQILSKK